jgi:hypothetical protein
MLNSFLTLFGPAALFGFIGYALYQGTKVHPDRNNTESGSNINSGQTPHDGFGGHG